MRQIQNDSDVINDYKVNVKTLKAKNEQSGEKMVVRQAAVEQLKMEIEVVEAQMPSGMSGEDEAKLNQLQLQKNLKAKEVETLKEECEHLVS